MSLKNKPDKTTLKASADTKSIFIYAVEMEQTMNSASLNTEPLSNTGIIFKSAI
ncbi:hypothetical protein SynBIOSE41_02915 [Synechococcus sp. BIOS-E4-1]|nr:hypothetical protein SynBIOSE41_02915 [Synechococcus sp. BIOS-E4-1]